MKPRQHIFPRVGELKKGVTYGARVTPKVTKASSASLNTTAVNTHSPDAAHNPRPGLSVFKRPVGRPRVGAARRRTVQRMASNRYWRRIRAERAALGLNSRGGIPKKKTYKFPHGIGQLHGVARKNAWRQMIREQRYAAGLTAEGNVPQRPHPKRGLILLTPLETNYRLFRATVPTGQTMDWDRIERI